LLNNPEGASFFGSAFVAPVKREPVAIVAEDGAVVEEAVG
jgi:hypothetical protein